MCMACIVMFLFRDKRQGRNVRRATEGVHRACAKAADVIIASDSGRLHEEARNCRRNSTQRHDGDVILLDFLDFSVSTCNCISFQLEEAAPHVVRAAQLLLKFSSNQLASSHFNSVLDDWNTHAQNLSSLVQDSLDPVAFIKALGDVNAAVVLLQRHTSY